MTAAELETALREADADDLIWSVFAAHDGGDVELHSLGFLDAFYSSNVVDFPATYAEMIDVSHVLTGATPIACVDAATAGVDLLSGCGRCAHL